MAYILSANELQTSLLDKEDLLEKYENDIKRLVAFVEKKMPRYRSKLPIDLEYIYENDVITDHLRKKYGIKIRPAKLIFRPFNHNLYVGYTRIQWDIHYAIYLLKAALKDGRQYAEIPPDSLAYRNKECRAFIESKGYKFKYNYVYGGGRWTVETLTIEYAKAKQ